MAISVSGNTDIGTDPWIPFNSVQFYLYSTKTIQLSQGTLQSPEPEPPIWSKEKYVSFAHGLCTVHSAYKKYSSSWMFYPLKICNVKKVIFLLLDTSCMSTYFRKSTASFEIWFTHRRRILGFPLCQSLSCSPSHTHTHTTPDIKNQHYQTIKYHTSLYTR